MAASRPMVLLPNDNITVVKMQTGYTEYGGCRCIEAPDACSALLACNKLCCCCKPSTKLQERFEESRYVYVRENSIEWNRPFWYRKNLCQIDVRDDVKVMYYDDPRLKKMVQAKPCCCDCTCACCVCFCADCGVHEVGQTVEMLDSCCLGMCYQSTSGKACLPICCPRSLASACGMGYSFMVVANAKETIATIEAARKSAKERMGISSPRAVSPRVPVPSAPTAVAVKVEDVHVHTGKAY